jgi:threonyl-tRNA synthetase
MLHRVILGAIERFMGVLIEHYAGAFPLWLSPVQAVIATVTDKHIPWGEEVRRRLFAAGIRVEGDFRNEKLGYKIREAQLQKTPFMLVIGDREMTAGQVSPRQRDGKSLEAIEPEAFIALVQELCSQFK